jgi:hypothetical protein
VSIDTLAAAASSRTPKPSAALALAIGLEGRIGKMQARRDRLHDRADKRRQIAREVMIEIDLRKLTPPDFAASIRPGIPALTVIDEAASPMSAPARPMTESFHTSKAGTRSQKPIASLGSMVGIERPRIPLCARA